VGRVAVEQHMARRILIPFYATGLMAGPASLSLRQLSTVHDYATLTREYQTDQPSKKHLDRYPLYPQKAKLMKRNSNNPRINIQRD